MNAKQKYVLTEVMRSLQEHPDEWSFSRGWATRGPISVWRLNRYYGTNISFNGTEVVGGVSYRSTLFSLFLRWSWRARLLAAVDAAEGPQPVPLDEAVASL